jgi:hypothetical protein
LCLNQYQLREPFVFNNMKIVKCYTMFIMFKRIAYIVLNEIRSSTIENLRASTRRNRTDRKVGSETQE